jgi:hypothetical protein
VRECSLRDRLLHQDVWRDPWWLKISIAIVLGLVSRFLELAGAQAARQPFEALPAPRLDRLLIGEWLPRIERYLRCKVRPGQALR